MSLKPLSVRFAQALPSVQRPTVLPTMQSNPDSFTRLQFAGREEDRYAMWNDPEDGGHTTTQIDAYDDAKLLVSNNDREGAEEPYL